MGLRVQRAAVLWRACPRVEAVWAPFKHLGMGSVLRVSEGGEELLIAGRSTDILGWAPACSLDENRIGLARIGGADAFDLDRVLPAVAEVVEVLQGFCPGVLENPQQSCLARVERS